MTGGVDAMGLLHAPLATALRCQCAHSYAAYLLRYSGVIGTTSLTSGATVSSH